jgi:hypothetical protein
MTHQIDQLKEEIQNKEQALVKGTVFVKASKKHIVINFCFAT